LFIIISPANCVVFPAPTHATLIIIIIKIKLIYKLCTLHRIKKLKSLSREKLVSVDECDIDLYPYREFAYSQRGKKVVAKISGKKFKRTNIVVDICHIKWVAPLEYSGSIYGILFEFLFKNCLLEKVEPRT
jgi:hypothetical protein